jgi:arylsulfatase
VSDDLGPQAGHFNGRIEWVQIDLGDDAADADHYTSPDERLRVAMSIQ